MPEHFRFESTNTYVVRHLTAAEIARVTTWQTVGLKYEFSFHTQHEAGFPCYLKEPTGPGRNLPKINLKEPRGLVQAESVKDVACSDDFEAVIAANLDLFRKMAKAFYEGVEVAPPPAPRALKFACTKKGPGLSAKIPGTVAQGGEMAWWATAKDRPQNALKCPLHKKADCLAAPTVVKLTPVEATKVPTLLV